MRKERQKKDYINLVIGKVRSEISAYETEEKKLNDVNLLFRKIIMPGDRNRDFYILSHTKEFRRLGKYLLYISKKLDDNQINFDNLTGNVTADAEFIRNEVMSYMSYPALRSRAEFAEAEIEKAPSENAVKARNDVADNPESDESVPEVTLYDEDDEKSPSNIYMRLLQSDDHSGDKAFELPGETGTDDEEHTLISEHHENTDDDGEAAFLLPSESESPEEPQAEGNENDLTGHRTENSPADETLTEEPAVAPFKKTKLTFGFDEDDSEFITGEKLIKETEIDAVETVVEQDDSPETAANADSEAADRIPLSEEFSNEIDEYIKHSEHEPLDASEDDQIANAEFLEYEREVRICNTYLNEELGRFVSGLPDEGDLRRRAAEAIIEAAQLLEERSRHMSFELISNIYQAISLSFEKIRDGKYDISEGTVSLLRQGLELIESLIRGEDYFVYKAALKSIENIRKNLTEEKKKKEEYSSRLRAKEEIQRELNVKYPQKQQRQLVNNILSNIRNTESIFKSTDYADGEFHTYEALKILSGSLNNFKNIVTFSKELNLPVLAQLSEAGYNFVKYLCNYRKDPATPENKEIFEYLIYTQKSLLLGRYVEDTEVFISYLNDPIRIFAKKKDQQTNPQIR